VDSSSEGVARFWEMAAAVKSRPRTSQTRPSVAVCFFALSSLRTRS
jgi:hypothetical protein